MSNTDIKTCKACKDTQGMRPVAMVNNADPKDFKVHTIVWAPCTHTVYAPAEYENQIVKVIPEKGFLKLVGAEDTTETFEHPDPVKWEKKRVRVIPEKVLADDCVPLPKEPSVKKKSFFLDDMEVQFTPEAEGEIIVEINGEAKKEPSWLRLATLNGVNVDE